MGCGHHDATGPLTTHSRHAKSPLASRRGETPRFGMNSKIIAVVGLRREAAVGGPGVVAVAGGGDGSALRERLEGCLPARSVRAVVSVGLGGALSPELRVGDWVVGERVVGAARAWTCDPRLAAELRAGLSRIGSAEPSAHG